MPLRCSESEESSISIDESDDNASFGHYRLKLVSLHTDSLKQLPKCIVFDSTRSSKGAIPEENLDDFASAEYGKGSGPSGKSISPCTSMNIIYCFY